MMRVAVVTPYCEEPPDVLRQCHESVRLQTYAKVEHIMIADGHPRAFIRRWMVHHLELPKKSYNNGNTPRAIGSLFALSAHFDAIAFLDADNWYDATHIETMVRLAEEQRALVCSSRRTLHRQDGTFLAHDMENDGRFLIDTSCLFLCHAAKWAARWWAELPNEFGPIGDRLIFLRLQRAGFKMAHTVHETVRFRSQYAVHYTMLGELPPNGCKLEEETSGPIRWWYALSEDARNQWKALWNIPSAFDIVPFLQQHGMSDHG